jgi:hypothetical protein
LPVSVSPECTLLFDEFVGVLADPASELGAIIRTMSIAKSSVNNEYCGLIRISISNLRFKVANSKAIRKGKFAPSMNSQSAREHSD